MIYSPPEDPVLPNEEVNGLSWCMNKNIEEQPGLGIRPPTHIKKEFQTIFLEQRYSIYLPFSL